MEPMQSDSGVAKTEAGEQNRALTGWRSWVTSPWRLPISIVGVALGGFLIGYLLSALIAFPSQRAAAALTVVPNVVGRTSDDARRIVERWELRYEEAAALHHTEPSGVVVAQDPLAGQMTHPGSTVHVTLSLGRKERPVPDVVGLSRRQAEIALKQAGYESDILHVDADADVGQVVGTRPNAGTVLALPGRVRLLVSAGPAMVGVPDLSNRSVAEAEAALERVGLRLGDVRQDASSFAAPGTVLDQRPAAGTLVERATRVRVTVAIVPPPAPADTTEGEEQSEG